MRGDAGKGTRTRSRERRWNLLLLFIEYAHRLRTVSFLLFVRNSMKHSFRIVLAGLCGAFLLAGVRPGRNQGRAQGRSPLLPGLRGSGRQGLEGRRRARQLRQGSQNSHLYALRTTRRLRRRSTPWPRRASTATPAPRRWRSRTTAAPPQAKPRAVTVSGIHNCCNSCNRGIDAAVKKVAGVEANTVKAKVETFDVTGDFDVVELVKSAQRRWLSCESREEIISDNTIGRLVSQCNHGIGVGFIPGTDTNPVCFLHRHRQ